MKYYIFVPENQTFSLVKNIMIDLNGNIWIEFDDKFLKWNFEECPLLKDIVGEEDIGQIYN